MTNQSQISSFILDQSQESTSLLDMWKYGQSSEAATLSV